MNQKTAPLPPLLKYHRIGVELEIKNKYLTKLWYLTILQTKSSPYKTRVGMPLHYMKIKVFKHFYRDRKKSDKLKNKSRKYNKSLMVVHGQGN